MRGNLAAITVALGLLAAPFGAGHALADQNDPRLDHLFARLGATTDAAEGARLGKEIVDIWRQSGRQEIDFLMADAQRFLKRREFYPAYARFERVVALAPDFAEGWNKRAHVLHLMGNFTASISDIQRALDLEPRHFLALAGLGLNYLRLESNRLALDAFERALRVNPHLAGTRRKAVELRAMVGRRSI